MKIKASAIMLAMILNTDKKHENKNTSQNPYTQAFARVFLMFLIVLSIILLAACAKTGPGDTGTDISGGVSEEKYTDRIFAMNTYMEITAYGGGNAPVTAAAERIYELEAQLSVTDEGSEVYALNHSQGGSFPVADDTAALLETALDISGRTNGALDITIYPIVKAWGFTTGEYAVPSKEELYTLLETVDYRLIRYNAEAQTVDLPESVEIDLGSVAKGYAGDEVMTVLREAGVSSALINLGGNVQVLGSKPDGSPWKIAVQNPEGTGYMGVIEVENKAVITSGGYERYFEDGEGNAYWHIIDPSTGYPARGGLVSVTIVGDSGVYCDALSTALFVMGLEGAAGYWRTYGDFEAVFVTETGEVYITEGLGESFSLAGDYEDAPLHVIED